MTSARVFLRTPVGTAKITASDQGVTECSILGEHPVEPSSGSGRAAEIASLAAEQLTAYFAGNLLEFTVPLDLHGTDFQLQVWQRLLEIPSGETVTYGRIAADLGSPQASRAVGLANHDNKVWVIVPCHRVIGADGALTGYAGGLECKRWLLEHEARVAGKTLWSGAGAAADR